MLRSREYLQTHFQSLFIMLKKPHNDTTKKTKLQVNIPEKHTSKNFQQNGPIIVAKQVIQLPVVYGIPVVYSTPVFHMGSSSIPGCSISNAPCS